MRTIRLDYVLLRSVVTLVVVLAVTLNSWWPAASVSSAAEMPVGATLKVLAVPVEVQPAQTETFVAATDGQMLNQGDVVRTGPGGLALLTFFDGSESQLGAESRVQIERAEATPAPQIALLQTAGVTMNHVVPMPPGGSFQTDTPAATGLVRGTSYVVVVGEGASESEADDRSEAQSTVHSSDSPPTTMGGDGQSAGDATAAGGPAGQTGLSQTVAGAPADDAGASVRTAFVCGLSSDQSCATSVVLLTDRDGHVGRVDVAAHGSSGAIPLQLSQAGDAATSNSGQTAAGKVAQPTLKALEAGANARNLPDAARAAEHHARVAAAALVRLTPPAPGDQPGGAAGQGVTAFGLGRPAPVPTKIVTPVVADHDDQASPTEESASSAAARAYADAASKTSGLTPTARPTPTSAVSVTAKHEVVAVPSSTPAVGSPAASVGPAKYTPPVNVPTLAPVQPGPADKTGKPTPVPAAPTAPVVRATPVPAALGSVGGGGPS